MTSINENWPPDLPPFLWGAATSSHQIEGCNNNDWTAYEEVGGVPHRSQAACDHYHRSSDDIALFSQLGLNAYRFSIEWSRIEPEPGRWDYAALDYYRSLIRSIRAHGMEPFLTLHHFSSPRWFADHGGFLAVDAPDLYARYVDKVMTTMADDNLKIVITVNEPLVYAILGYGIGLWPPGHHHYKESWRVVENFVKSHEKAYRIIKSYSPHTLVGLAHHIIQFAPSTSSILDTLNRNVLHYLFNTRLIKKLRPFQDFIGVNYYTRQWVHWRHFFRPVQSQTFTQLTDMGWEIFPQGLTEILMELAPYHRPLIVTENGIATQNDALRKKFLYDHLQAISKAQSFGAAVRGYFYWSAVDNFEWSEGFGPRFGLIHVDYASQTRTLKPSALYYRDLIDRNRSATTSRIRLPSVPPRL